MTDTYLNIFLSLGGLGLLLGLVSLLIVIRKNLTARRDEIRLYHTLGFSSDAVVSILRREQFIVPLMAITAGALGCILISFLLRWWGFALPGITDTAWTTAIVLLLMMLAFTWIIIHISINSKTIQQCETY